MEQLKVIGPALAMLGMLAVALLIYSFLALIGKRPRNIDQRNHSALFHYFIDYFVWLIKPAQKLLQALPITPNQITISSLFVCMAGGLCVATNHMATAGWLYILAGALDVLDGRIARAKGIQSKAGAFLDSIADRWCELFVLSGFVWLLRDTNWLPVTILAIIGSLMTSYVRAKGDSLNIVLDGGIMQRAERMTVVSIALLTTAWFNSVEATKDTGLLVLGVSLLVVGLGASFTAVGRWRRGFALLAEQERSNQLEKHIQASPDDDLRIPTQS